VVSDAPAVALTIAGSDSGGGAGIQADLKTFQAFGVWGTSAITAVTAQNTLGVQQSQVLPAALVRAQIDAVAGDIGVAAAKTGMLGSAEVILAVVAAVAENEIAPLVVDPVIVTSHGDLLLEPDALAVLRDRLLPVCALVTPNLPEAEALVGRKLNGVDDMPELAAAVGALGARAVLLKGGHLEGARSPDLLWTGGMVEWLDGPRLAGRNTHGTGCTLSAAVCAELALGSPLRRACVQGKAFVSAAISAGLPLGHGVGPVNPGGAPRP
jgi:hydroxymethylpyrimidine/phosphomethylpyrimidine kinase